MATWNEGDVRADGRTVHYYRAGGDANTPLVLLHGITDNGLCWTRVAQYFEDRYNIFMIDARGHGKSGLGDGSLTAETLAEDTAIVIWALGLDGPFVYGHSMGATTAAALAATQPGLARAVVLEDPPFIAEMQEDAADEQARPQSWEWVAQVQALSQEERVAVAAQGNPKWHEDELVQWADAKGQVNLSLFHSPPTLHEYPWRTALQRIECPILLITGDVERGAIVTPQVAEEAARPWRDGRVAHIEGAGHSVHRDRFEETMRVVEDFLREQSVRG